MKNSISILFLLFTILTFGQRKEYNKAGKLFLNKEYAAANEIIEKILVDYNIDKLDIELKYYILTIASDSNYNLNHYEKALNYYTELKKIVVDGKIEVQDKKTFISRIDKLTEELLSKIKKDDTIPQNNSNDNTTASLDNGTKSATTKSMSDDKIVTLTVTGSGKTLEEAKLNALRSAIEQAFGTFISSKTEILNDNLVKDEILSVSNGNIQKFDVVSEITLPSGIFATTLSATVSINKLSTFAESKGVVVEFKGSLFAANIKLQKLNEEAENKVMTSLFGLMHENLQSVFDYKIETKNPILNEDQINYSVPVKVTAIGNQNFDVTTNYLINTLNAISLKNSELEDYINLKKQVYKVEILYNNKNNVFYLRNDLSFQCIKLLSKSWEFYLGCYQVNNDINTIDGPGGYFFKANYYNMNGQNFAPFISAETFSDEYRDFHFKDNQYTWQDFTNGRISYKLITLNTESMNELVLKIPSVFSEVATFEWNDFKTLAELEKINSYVVKPTGTISEFKNGGYVIYENNGHGIIACPLSYSIGSDWGISDPLINTGKEIMDGKTNTIKISALSDKNIGKASKNISFSGYKDWVIPSENELKLLFDKLYLTGILKSDNYMISSTLKGDYDFPKIFALTNRDFFKSFLNKNISNNNLSVKKNNEHNDNKSFNSNKNDNSHYYTIRDIQYSGNVGIQAIRYF